MVLMVIDHARDYSAGPGVVADPMDLGAVTPLLFVMRWLAHFCAPVFALAMGASVYLSARGRPKEAVAAKTWRRGLLLVLLEFTVIDWAWNFYPLWPRKFFQVIGALGISLVILSAFVRWDRRWALAVGAGIVALHNLTDGVRFDPASAAHYVWSFLHQKNVLPLGGGFEVRTTYPFLPVAGVALLGYGFGEWIAHGGRRLVMGGVAMLGAFFALRLGIGYGDASLFAMQRDALFTVFSALNVTKYPLSLQFVLMTLGPAWIVLGLRERYDGWLDRVLRQLGRVPMCFYIVHLYLVHAFALIWAAVAGLGGPDWRRFGGIPAGFGFPLWVTIPFALFVVAATYPVCRWYEALRGSRRHRWTEYL